ncbi:MAG: NAD-dependent epimerase/dehydratase family protein, partial [Leptospiraceae bacterium]|nr:NAD-dependent epimerase/dehydratase family protein [Leptospiraceae bacterium]
ADPLLPEILEESLHQCDAIVHTAAPVKEKGPLEDFRAINVVSTLALARKAADCGVRRWTQLSSVMVYGFHYPPDVGEEGPLRGDGNPYCITKIESEHALLGLSGSQGMDVVILRPGDVYGPGSVPWVVRPLEMMKKKQFLLLDGGRYAINHTHVSHIVQAVELSLKTRGGQIFNITDGISSSCLEYFGALA